MISSPQGLISKYCNSPFKCNSYCPTSFAITFEGGNYIDDKQNDDKETKMVTEHKGLKGLNPKKNMNKDTIE